MLDHILENLPEVVMTIYVFMKKFETTEGSEDTKKYDELEDRITKIENQMSYLNGKLSK